MRTLKGYLLYEPEDAKKNNAFIEMFLAEAAHHDISLSLLLTTDSRLYADNNISPSADINMQLHVNALWHVNTKNLGNPDFIINRSRIPTLSKALEKCGIHVFNNAKVCEICNDKQLTYDYLDKYGIPVMNYCWVEENHISCSDLALYTKKAEQFAYPFVLKPADGHGGKHVVLINNKEKLCKELLSIRNDYSYLPKLIFQRCASDIGKDLRVYVLDGKIVAGMMRHSQENTQEIRANFSLGGTAKLHTLTKEETALTLQISTALPADLVGIDFIYHNGHPVFNEIEDVVGTRMLYQYTNINIVKEYMSYIMSKIKTE